MTIIDTIVFFERLLKGTTKKREAKVYKNFIGILSGLETRDFLEEELQTIQSKIESLDLKSNAENKRNYYAKKLQVFKTFLKKEFSLITEGYYMSLGIGLGLCFGVAIGTSFGPQGSSMGVSLGMLIGLVIGRAKDLEAEKDNRVLKV